MWECLRNEFAPYLSLPRRIQLDFSQLIVQVARAGKAYMDKIIGEAQPVLILFLFKKHGHGSPEHRLVKPLTFLLSQGPKKAAAVLNKTGRNFGMQEATFGQ